MAKFNHKWHVCEAMLNEGISCKVTLSGHSMRPLLRSGSTAEVRPYGKSKPAIGDVVLAKDSLTGRYLMHRIISLKDGHYTLKGDNCDKADKVFTKQEILGKLTKINDSHNLLNTWPARKALAFTSHSGRRIIKAGLALKKLIKK